MIERASDGSYSAYLPDLPGCVLCGDTVEEVKAMIQEAVEFHLEGLRDAGLPIPTPSALSEYIAAVR